MDTARIAAIWVAAGCALLAAAPAHAADGASWKSVTLAPGELREECLNLKAGSRLLYAFEVTDSLTGRLDFNIHTTRNDVMRFLFKKSAVRRGDAVFQPLATRDYCMMWSNPGEQILQFRFRFDVSED